MTDEQREQLDALITALGEYEEAKFFDASLTPPLPDRRSPRFESANIHRQRFDDNRTLTDTKRAVLKAAVNARPALKALVARLELADRMFALFEEYYGTGRAEAYADMVDTYHSYRAAKEATDD